MTSSVEGAVQVIARLELENAELRHLVDRLTAQLLTKPGVDPRWADVPAKQGDYCRRCGGAPAEGSTVRFLTTAPRRVVTHVVCPVAVRYDVDEPTPDTDNGALELPVSRIR